MERNKKIDECDCGSNREKFMDSKLCFTFFRVVLDRLPFVFRSLCGPSSGNDFVMPAPSRRKIQHYISTCPTINFAQGSTPHNAPRMPSFSGGGKQCADLKRIVRLGFLSLSNDPNDPMYWFALIPALVVGFLTPLPYNYYKLKKFNQACH